MATIEQPTKPAAGGAAEANGAGDQPAAEDATPSGVRGHHIALFIGLIVVAAGIVIGVRAYIHSLHYESTDDAYLDADVVSVSPKVAGHLVEVLVNNNQKVRQGQVLARIDARDFESEVAKARAELDSTLAKRDAARVALEMTSVTTQADLSQAASGVSAAHNSADASQAQAAASRSNLAGAEANVAHQEAAAQEAEANAQSAAAMAQRAENDYKRYQSLKSGDVISQQELDHARTEWESANAKYDAAKRQAAAAKSMVDQARAALNSAREAISQAQSQSGEKHAMIGQAQSELTRAGLSQQRIAMSRLDMVSLDADAAKLRAQLDLAELDLSRTTIVSPTTGTVTKKAIEPGTYVAVGQPLLSIVPDEVWVVANFKETQLTHLRAGQPAEIVVDAFPDRTLKGHVDSIQSGTGSRFSLFPPENATGNFIKVVQRVPVKILIDAEDDPLPPLSPGMSAVPEVKVK